MHSSFTVTVFPDRFAKRKREYQLTLNELRDFVLSKKKRTKHRLPLIKLASFGETRNENDCLRYDANVNTLSGTEVDYDREEIPFDNFVVKMSKTGVRSLIYTSPSCTPTRPRARIILPFRKSLSREHLHRRGMFVSRIDGLFGGNVFGSESWTLSQTYYAGRDLSNADADFRAVVIEGDCIDERDDLRGFEAISVAARQKIKEIKLTTVIPAKALDVVPAGTAMRRDDAGKRDDRTPFQRHAEELLYGDADAALALMDYKERRGGNGVHKTQRDVSYQLIARGMLDEVVIERVLVTTFALPEAAGWNRKRERKKIEKLCNGAHRRLERERQELFSMPVQKQDHRRALSLREHRIRQREHIEKAFRRE